MTLTYRFTYAFPIFEKKNLVVQSGKYSKGGGVWWKDSIYYLWFIFLQMNDEYIKTCKTKKNSDKRKHKVYKDFGDIRLITFKEWWKQKGEYLFGVQRLSQVEVIKTNTPKNDSNIITLAVPLTIPKRIIAREIKTIVNKCHPAKRGSNVNVTNLLNTKYKPTNNRVKTLKKVLQYKQMQMKYPNDRKIDVYNKCFEDLAKKNDQHICSTHASRLISKYNKIEKNIVLGIF